MLQIAFRLFDQYDNIYNTYQRYICIWALCAMY